MILFIGFNTKAYTLVPYTDTNGNYLTYTGTSSNVMIPSSYEQQKTYFRGIWVTPKDGSNITNIKTGSGKSLAEEIEDYKAEVIQIFDVMEYYNLNALIFHIRIDNDAIYYSTLNPWSDWFTTYGVDPGWDPLTWIIEECHNRGYEFHAWMNPYRIKAASDKTIAELASMIRTYCPNNIGADVSNILGEKDGGAILNPGIPAVRKFIVDTCMEVIRNYDVDAIHFDDYFYSDMGASGALSGTNSILTEPDQDTYLKYKSDEYSATSATDKANWRREQVDLFIEELSGTMRMYNNSTGRSVQLGISPSGIWKSGDGKVTYDIDGNAITNGSNTTTTFEHYGGYLFSDTLKWINEEWIDYILPQMYWGFTHPSAAFADLCDWWAKVVKYKNVLLYSGMGIYMSETPGKNYSWGKDYMEAYNQILYATKLNTVSGTVFYNYGYLKSAYLGDQSSLYGRGMKLIKEEMFTNPAILPEIKSMEAVKLNDVTNLEVVKSDTVNTITFNAVDEAKFYVVYRSEPPLTFATDQIYKIIGPTSVDDMVTFVDEVFNDIQYVYGIKVMSRTNTLSDGVDFGMLSFEVKFTDEAGNLLSTMQVPYGNSAVAPTAPTKPGATFIGWSQDISSVKSDLTVKAKYSYSLFTVTFYDNNNEVMKTEDVNYNGTAQAPDTTKEGYAFINWSTSFVNVIYDLNVYANYQINVYTVTFKDYDGSIISEADAEYMTTAIAPSDPKRTGWTFVGWDTDISGVKSDLTVTAVYEVTKFAVTFINDRDDSIIEVQEVAYGNDVVYPTAPVVRGYEFSNWRGVGSNVLSDRTIYAVYSISVYTVIFKDWDGTILSTNEVVYGEEVEAPNITPRPNYNFSGWDTDFSDVAQNLIITAQYAPYTYTVKFFGPNNELLHEEIVEYGQKAPDFIADVEGYRFISWDTDYSEVTEDLNVYGTFEEIKGGCQSLSMGNILGILTIGIAFIILKNRYFR